MSTDVQTKAAIHIASRLVLPQTIRNHISYQAFDYYEIKSKLKFNLILVMPVSHDSSYVYEKENSGLTTFGTEVVQFREVCLTKVKTYLLTSIKDMRTHISSGVVELVSSTDLFIWHLSFLDLIKFDLAKIGPMWRVIRKRSMARPSDNKKITLLNRGVSIGFRRWISRFTDYQKHLSGDIKRFPYEIEEIISGMCTYARITFQANGFPKSKTIDRKHVSQCQ